MVKINFENAVVRDDGYGLYVNGKSLKEIISTALGARVGEVYGYGSGVPEFTSNCCNVTVIIDPRPITESIENDTGVWHSVEEMKEDLKNEYEKIQETSTKE